MRFFSNEAKDNADERETDSHSEHTPAGPAAVPQQRAGSPWQHHPAEDTGQEIRPVAAASSTTDGPDDRPDDRLDDPDRTDRLPGADDRTVAVNDGVPGSNAAVTDARDHDGVPGHEEAAWPTPAGAGPGPRRDDPVVDLALEDRGTFDDPHATQPIRTGSDEPRHPTDEDHDGVADADETIVDRTPEDRVQDRAVAPEPLVTAASESTISGPAPFFPEADTQPLRDRWRDVQLRFVDDPKGATAEAAELVDEAVDKLTQALRTQRGALAKGSDETESLRVELRSYRDILDRLLGL